MIATGGPVRTFLSPDSALGFGTSDYIELLAAAMLGLIALVFAIHRPAANRLPRHPARTLILIATLPVALRLALLPRCPVPVPSGADDFSYMLLADTLRHFRLANPPHVLPQFFEQIFVLQQPTHSSMYALGQGIAIAIGWMIFGHPWAGVLLSVAALCGACYWMLRGWVSPEWAFAGVLIAVMEFGPLSYWTNSYWGGAVSAAAGCLVFGALPRIREYGRLRDAAVLGLGLAIQLLARPFEFFFLLFSVCLFFIPVLRRADTRRPLWRTAAVMCLFLSASATLMLFQNKRVTGSWTTLPYMLYRYQYGVPAAFTIQSNPVPHRLLNEEQELDYRAESVIHGTGRETLKSYVQRLFFRLRFLRFFLLAPLYLAAVAFLVTAREFRYVWVLATIATFALGSNFYPYFYPHYVAALASLFVLVAVVGLEKLNTIRIGARLLPPLGSLILLVCAAHFLFWFGVHATGDQRLLSRLAPFETWDYINYGDPQGRVAINNQLVRQPGKKLVFVHYAPGHRFEEWVHNGADIDAAETVWAHDLGPAENQKLRAYYRDRAMWLLEPDYVPPKLRPYPEESSGFQDVR